MNIGFSFRELVLAGLSAVGVVLLAASVSYATAAAVITDDDIVPTDTHAVGSGNGTLDFILFTESSGGASNTDGSFNGDDANTDMPTGNSDTSANESFVTSFGDLRQFFLAEFPDGGGGSTVNEIVLYVDLNQVPNGPVLSLNTLSIFSDYLDGGGGAFGDDRDDPWGTNNSVDVSSTLQNSTDADFSGGTLLASLDGPKLLPLNNTGAGFADYAIFTHVNPFDAAFSDDTRVLFHWESTGNNGGGETVFLSGDYTGGDTLAVPEPGTLGVLAFAGIALLVGRRRRH